jgi:Uma2 family endonuclease
MPGTITPASVNCAHRMSGRYNWVVAATTRFTIEDFERLPAELAHHRELVDGELVDVSGNVPAHNFLKDLLIELLGPHVCERKLGKIISEREFKFGDDAHGPDVSLIGPDKIPSIQRRRVQLFVPDLAIEIVSDNDSFTSLMKKAERYRKSGTREVWILSQETREAFVKSEERRALLSDQDFFESPQIPGFRIRLGELFDRA